LKHVTAPPNRNILFIAYHFPPSAAVGGQRAANFAATLRVLGWQPQVLTIADENIERLDPDRLRDVEGIPIQKAGVLPTAVALAGWLWMRVRRRRTNGTAGGPASQPVPQAQRGAARGFRRFILSLLVLPDWERGWCIPATLHAWRTIRRQRIGWFVTSCPPYSVHLIGLAVKLLTRRHWIADFRDPWMTTGSKRLYPTSRLSMRIESWLERHVIEKADLVVFNVERLRNAYRDRYAWVPAAKFAFIPNGITSRAAHGPAKKYDVFTISYTGSLYVGRSPEPVLEAVARLIQQQRLSPQEIQVKLVGQCGVIDGVATETVVRRHGLESIVEVREPVPYSDAFDIIRRSHLALLLAPNLPYQIPAKVYDYLGAGTRILAIAEEGGTADLLKETASGRAFRSEEVEAIADFIHAEFATRGSGDGPSPSLARYDVRRITEDLVGHLTRVGDAVEPARAR
jgi:glycosyltransferase involved in cell wall biosynthesis